MYKRESIKADVYCKVLTQREAMAVTTPVLLWLDMRELYIRNEEQYQGPMRGLPCQSLAHVFLRVQGLHVLLGHRWLALVVVHVGDHVCVAGIVVGIRVAGLGSLPDPFVLLDGYGHRLEGTLLDCGLFHLICIHPYG